MEKKELRKSLIDKRNNIEADLRYEKSILIRERLEKLEVFQEAYTVLFYVSFRSEVDTHQLIKDTLETEKRVIVPRVEKNGNLLLKKIEDFSQLKPSSMNILEPSQEATEIALSEINLIIVPGVAFTRDHCRLGYGGGFYDKLLSHEDKAGFTSIALAFSEQIVPELPVEEHDQKVDFILTDKRII